MCLCVTGRSAPIYKVLSIDYSSALEMLNKEYQKMSFDDLDLLDDLKVCFKMSRLKKDISKSSLMLLVIHVIMLTLNSTSCVCVSLANKDLVLLGLTVSIETGSCSFC